MILIILKKLLAMVLRSLEKNYPGLSFIIDKVIALLDGGTSSAQIVQHLSALRKD